VRHNVINLGSELAEALATCIGDAERDVRLAALEALGLLGARGWLGAQGAQGAWPPVVRALVRAAASGGCAWPPASGRDGDDAHARMLALHALACQRPAPSAECIAVLATVAADDQDNDLRRAAARGLGTVLEALCHGSTGDGESTRRQLACARALGGLGAMTRDADDGLRETAAAVLRAAAISARSALPASETTIVAAVAACVSDASGDDGEDVVCAAAVWFGEVLDLTDLVRDNRVVVTAGGPTRSRRSIVAPYLRTIAQHVVNGNARVVAVVARAALGRAGKAAAPYVASLAARLDDDNPDVRSAAASSLAVLASVRSGAVAAHVQDAAMAGALAQQLVRASEAAAPGAARADAETRSQTLAACAPLLHHHRAVVEPHVRHVASRALDEDGGAGLTAAALACLGRTADAAIVERIAARLTHAAPVVRAAAMRALGDAGAVGAKFELVLRALTPAMACTEDDSDEDEDGGRRSDVREAAHAAFATLAPLAEERVARYCSGGASAMPAGVAAAILCDPTFPARRRDAAAGVLRALSGSGGVVSPPPDAGLFGDAPLAPTSHGTDGPLGPRTTSTDGLLGPRAPSDERAASEEEGALLDSGATSPVRKKHKSRPCGLS